MRKSTKRTPVGDSRARYTVIYTGEPVDPALGDIDKTFKQVFMLQQLVEQQELLNCGTSRFQKMKMYFSGDTWVVELEATLDEPTPPFVPGESVK